ncbi:ABC transporter ATP-binding protein [Tautonia sociabilis]|uniref:ATP-binding cassette domain-containing protein n=1 Tax=Tautonia sociabilis TaxID=2080755 RepID=A0A432MIG9_9BACT|nr:polysaccharide ABC transporter ATP-binding protein [Tautonia sociabilis]RUL87164.1 ATP-binding cassette domain-containing protein [Tautonia sociabilis]
MADPAILVENLSKVYRIGSAEERHETLSGAALGLLSAPLRNLHRLRSLDASRSLRRPNRPTPNEHSDDLLWALRDVSFQVHRGEVLGVIGRNGAGKSTLLKILSRVASPSAGRVTMFGRVSSLLEVGTGFHPELTGRENVYLNGTILGMRKAEIDRKFDQIVDFSGVSRFLDTPVKRYSSGMKVRLAFAVAAHLEPEILIVDEVLAVGDYEFQRRCLGKMEDVARGGEGRTVLFVSHNMGMMRSLCNRAICLRQGELVFEGAVADCIEYYENANGASQDVGIVRFEEEETKSINILEVKLINSTGRCCTSIDQFEPLDARITYRVRRPVSGRNLSIALSYKGERVFVSFDTDMNPERLSSRTPGDYEDVVALPTKLLKAGLFSITVTTGTVNGHNVTDMQRFENCLRFEIRETADSTLKSYSPTRPGCIAVRLPWRSGCSVEKRTV